MRELWSAMSPWLMPGPSLIEDGVRRRRVVVDRRFPVIAPSLQSLSSPSEMLLSGWKP